MVTPPLLPFIMGLLTTTEIILVRENGLDYGFYLAFVFVSVCNWPILLP